MDVWQTLDRWDRQLAFTRVRAVPVVFLLLHYMFVSGAHHACLTALSNIAQFRIVLSNFQGIDPKILRSAYAGKDSNCAPQQFSKSVTELHETLERPPC